MKIATTPARKILLWAGIAAALIAIIFTVEVTWPDRFNSTINPYLWVAANAMLAYVGLSLVFYVVFYGLKFRWNANAGGRIIFAFTLSLLGLVALSVVAVFFDPVTEWTTYPEGIQVWRPTFRLLVYTGIAAALTGMNGTLIRRALAAENLNVTVPARPNHRARSPRGSLDRG